MSLARTVTVLASVVLLATVAGCGGRSIGDDLNAKTDPTKPPPVLPDGGDPTPCADIAPACDPGDRTVANEASCGSEAAYCYSRASTCENDSPSLVWCAHDNPVQCDARPACDQGDTQVTQCPVSRPVGVHFTCYTRSACGSSIGCVKPESSCTALPQCNAGDVEVTKIDTCSQPGISCYPVTECNFTIHCYTP